MSNGDYVRISCPGCQKRLKVLKSSVGKVVRCPLCSARTRIRPPKSRRTEIVEQVRGMALTTQPAPASTTTKTAPPIAWERYAPASYGVSVPGRQVPAIPAVELLLAPSPSAVVPVDIEVGKYASFSTKIDAKDAAAVAKTFILAAATVVGVVACVALTGKAPQRG
jgi:ribosomal protein S27E